MPSYNGKNKRRKRKDFAKKRRIVELHSRFDDANRQQHAKESKAFEASIAKELAEDFMMEQKEG